MPAFSVNNLPIDHSRLSHQLNDYLYHRMVMAFFSRLPHLKMKPLSALEFDDCLHETGIDSDSVTAIHEAKLQMPGFDGIQHPVTVCEVEQGDRKIWILEADTDSHLTPVFGKKVIISPTSSGHSTTTSNGIIVTDKIGFQAQQTHGIKVFEKATRDGKHAQAIVYATGTGKSFVLIAPAIANKKGIFIVPDDKQVNQLKRDILLLDEDPDKSIATSVSVRAGQEEATIRDFKHIIIKKSDVKRFIPHLHNRLISIDEVHEIDPKDLEALQAPSQNNMLQVVTATWTDTLREKFGKPLTDINMHFALNQLKAFRNIGRNLHRFTEDENIDRQVFDILADYYGGVAFIRKDNMPENSSHTPRYLPFKALHDVPEGEHFLPHKEVRRIRESREIRRFDHMNMAFCKNEELLKKLTKAYQGVFDGDYEHVEELAEKVSGMRAEARIREELRLLRVSHNKTPVPEHIDLDNPDIREAFARVIAASKITGASLQAEAQNVLKQQIANVITRKIVGLFTDNTSAMSIYYQQQTGTLDKMLELYSGPKEKLDDRELEFTGSEQNRVGGAVYEQIAKELHGVRNKDEILAALASGNYTKLKVDKDNIDLSRFERARYATMVPPGTEGVQCATETAERINKGYHTHIIGDSELATGYSNPYIMSVQRIITNVKEDSVIRATQMLGRVVRARDGLAFASEYLSHNLHSEAPLGEPDRPFLFEDVVAENYMERVRKFMAQFVPNRHPAPNGIVRNGHAQPANGAASAASVDAVRSA